MAAWLRFSMEYDQAGRLDRLFPLLESQIEDMRDIWRDVADALAKRLETTFATEGPGWAELRPFTQRERARKGFPPAHPILEQTGTLKRSFVEVGSLGNVARFEKRTMEFGSSIPYAVEHQRGREDMVARRILQPEQLIPVVSRAVEDAVTVEVRRTARQFLGT